MSMSILMMAGNLAMSAMQTSADNKAIDRQQAAREEQQRARDAETAREVEELNRQQAREDLIAQEEKSDRARILDREVGELIAAASDDGSTAASLAAQGGNAAAIMGLDVARIESNRQEAQWSRRASSTSIIEANKQNQSNTKAYGEQAAGEKRANTMGFVGNTVSTGFKAYGSMSSNSTSTDTKVTSAKIKPIRRDSNWDYIS